MSVQAEQAAALIAPDTRHGHYHHHNQDKKNSAITSLFSRSPVRIFSDAQDSTTQQIQSKLGNLVLVNKHLPHEPKRLLGIEGLPASLVLNKPGGPCSFNSSSSQQQERLPGFAKPVDTKLSYPERSSYSGHAVKHCVPEQQQYCGHGGPPPKPLGSSSNGGKAQSSQPNTQRPSTLEEGEIVQSRVTLVEESDSAMPATKSNPSSSTVGTSGGSSSSSKRNGRSVKSAKGQDAKSSDVIMPTTPAASNSACPVSANSSNRSSSGSASAGHATLPALEARSYSVKRKRTTNTSSEPRSASSQCSKRSNGQGKSPKQRNHHYHSSTHDREERQEIYAIPPPRKRVYYSYFYSHSKRQAQLDSCHEQYLAEAERLKHSADKENDVTTQCLLYLEGVMYFILTGQAMESAAGTERGAVYRMYKDALSFIKLIVTKVLGMPISTPESNIHRKLIIFSLWCQSLIYQKLFRLKGAEIKQNYAQLTEYHRKVMTEMKQK